MFNRYVVFGLLNSYCFCINLVRSLHFVFRMTYMVFYFYSIFKEVEALYVIFPINILLNLYTRRTFNY